MTTPYTRILLQEILKEGNATLVGEFDKFTQRTIISFICKCGEKVNKKYEMLRMHRLPYCKACSVKEHEERKKASCIKKYGVENVFCMKETMDKINNSWNKLYGCHPKKTKEVQEKWRQTCLIKYGGHPNQNKEVQEKSENNSYKFKDYRTPSGRIIKYQGYENIALDELYSKGYNESDIITGRGSVPIIKYNIDTTKHVYFPDIYIKSENKIIEVKSEWTIQLKKANIVEKAEATISEGYMFEIWVYDTNKNKVNEIYYNDLVY